MKKKSSFKTERLVLKSIEIVDKNNLLSILCDEEIRKTYMIPLLDTNKKKDRMFDYFMLLSKDEDRFTYGIYLNDRLIGFINDVENNKNEIELGYVIDSLYHNNGYASEVLKEAINQLFEIGYERVNTGYFVENLASKRVMEKVGMIPSEQIIDIEYEGKIHQCAYFYKVKY